MTDSKTATERLREMLDERGVEWADQSNGYATVTKYSADGVCWHAVARHYIEPSNDWMILRADSITPEQAIAATLESGTLTAEQVRELIAPHLHARPTFDFGRHGAVWGADFQAIADELNAELGSGECEAIHDRHYYRGINGICEGLYCSKCGEPLSNKFEHCPWCGAKIRKVVKR